MQKYEDNIATQLDGGALVPMSGVTITVIDQSINKPAALYSDNGVTPITAPIVTDDLGHFAFFAADGRYTINFSSPRIVTFSRDVILEDPKDNPYATLAQLAAPTGATNIGNGTETVADSLNALQLADYTALRAYVGSRKSVYVSGYLGTAAPLGIAGFFTRDDSDTTSTDNGGTIIVATNGNRWKRRHDGPINVRWFGAAGDGVTDDTAAIQAAINYLSNTQNRTLYFPGRTYNFTSLYAYYDATLNPGYNVNRNGEITLQGDGISPENGGIAGTILYTTNTTGDGLIVSPASADTVPYTGRDFRAVGISFQGATSGFLVSVQGVPGTRFHDCEFIQNNLAGSGLRITTTYFGELYNIRAKNLASGTKTGDAIRFSTSIAAGILTMRGLNVGGYANGLNMTGGSWQLMTIAEGELSGSNYALYVSAGSIDVLNLNGVYFEGACTSFIKDASSNAIRVLNAKGIWGLGSGLTGPAFDLSAPNVVNIDGGSFQDQNKTFLNIAALPSGGNGGYFVRGMNFPRTGAAPSAVTLFTGQLPQFHGVDYASGDPNVIQFASTARPIRSRTNYASSSYLAAGHMLETSTKNYGAVSGGSLNIQSDGYPAWVTIYNVTSPTIVYLPAISAGLPHGYTCTVTSSAASTQTFTVNAASADGGASLGNIGPGVQRKFVFFNDGTTTGWK